MNPFNTIHISARAGVILALSKSCFELAKSVDSLSSVIQDNVYDAVLLSCFILFFNLKCYFDDVKHFKELDNLEGNPPLTRTIGIILFLPSVVFLFISASLIFSDLLKALTALAISIGIATIWILVHLYELYTKDHNLSEIITQIRQKWFLLNIAYIICITAYIGCFKSFIAPQITGYLIAMLIVLLFDFLTSQSFKNLFRS